MNVWLHVFWKIFGYFDSSVFCEHFNFGKTVLRVLCCSLSED